MKMILPDGSVQEAEDELRVIRHTASHVLAQAVKRLYPETKLAIGPAIDDGFYYDFDREGGFTPEDLEKLEEEMAKIVKENLPVKPFVLPRNEAIQFMKEKEEPYKVELIEDLPEEETISLSQLPTEALKTSQAQEDAARRKQADTAAAAADAAAKEAARQNLLSEYDGVQLTEAVRLRSAADNDTATSLTIDSGKVARLNDYQDGWYQVTFGQSTGYIPAEYAQPVHYADYEGTSATNTVREELIAYAYTYLGTPYVYGGSSYSGTDCSGFTMAVFAKFGYSLSHGASDQYYTATSVSSEERQAGDLVFFDTFGGISHVGIYLGGGQFIHASSSGGVKVNSLYESYYAACYLGAGRILP